MIRTFTFDAAHQLPWHTGRCRNLHGHTYRLEVTVEGPIGDDGIVVDFADLDAVVRREIIDRYDHTYLNDHLDNPTAELIAADIWKRLEAVGALAPGPAAAVGDGRLGRGAAGVTRSVVVLSGGLDSTVCMGVAHGAGAEMVALTFDYGQRHRVELEHAAAVAAHYGAEQLVVRLDASQWGGSALTDTSIDVPDAADAASGPDRIPATYVPARNLIFLSIAVGRRRGPRRRRRLPRHQRPRLQRVPGLPARVHRLVRADRGAGDQAGRRRRGDRRAHAAGRPHQGRHRPARPRRRRPARADVVVLPRAGRAPAAGATRACCGPRGSPRRASPTPPWGSPVLVVAEVFGPTFQGEGPSAGRRAMFLRLGRCNLDCAWCDTPYTWDWSRFDPAVELHRRTVDDVMSELDAHRRRTARDHRRRADAPAARPRARRVRRARARMAGRGRDERHHRPHGRAGRHWSTSGTSRPSSPAPASAAVPIPRHCGRSRRPAGRSPSSSSPSPSELDEAADVADGRAPGATCGSCLRPPTRARSRRASPRSRRRSSSGGGTSRTASTSCSGATDGVADVRTHRSRHARPRRRRRRPRAQPGDDGRRPARAAAASARQGPQDAPRWRARQLAAGHPGLTCATIREAEGLAAAGLAADLLVANEVVDARRLGALVAAGARVTLAVDSDETVDAAADGGVREVLIDVNVGLPRCGCDPADGGRPRRPRPAARARRAGRDGLRGPPDDGAAARRAVGQDGRGDGAAARRRTPTSAARSCPVAAPAPTTSTPGSPRSRPARTCSWTPRTARSACPSGQRSRSRPRSSRSTAAGWAVADCGLKALGMDHGDPSIEGCDVWYCSDEHVTFSGEPLPPCRRPRSASARPRRPDRRLPRADAPGRRRHGGGDAGRSTSGAGEAVGRQLAGEGAEGPRPVRHPVLGLRAQLGERPARPHPPGRTPGRTRSPRPRARPSVITPSTAPSAHSSRPSGQRTSATVRNRARRSATPSITSSSVATLSA